MSFRRMIAVWAAKFSSFVSIKCFHKQGVTICGQVALKLCPSILKDLAAQVEKGIFITCGTNGKTTTNNMLCAALEAEGYKVICNHTGSNMLAGVAAAFVLAAGANGKLKADYACIEIDEASTKRVFPHFKPNYMVLTNLFRDQLDRYGEIDTTMNLLKEVMKTAPEMKVIVNGDDALSAYLAMDSGNQYITYGISEQVIDNSESKEIREGRFCKKCGAPLEYEFYHYSQLGKYHCSCCDFERPTIDFDAQDVILGESLAFTVGTAGGRVATGGSDASASAAGGPVPAGGLAPAGGSSAAACVASGSKNGVRLTANYRGFYNCYNILAAYTACKVAGIATPHFNQMLANYNPENGRMEQFDIRGTHVLLNLAKNPAGFNQNIFAVMQDEKPKDIIILINDNEQDGTDISWLWDVDFDRFGDANADSITVSGIRAQDMRLRMKYVNIPVDLNTNIGAAIEEKIANGCGNLYVLVNYTALYSTHDFLKKLEAKQ